MNILIYRYGSICEPDIIEAFEELGFSMDSVTEEIYDKRITAEKQLALVHEALTKRDYHFVFTINFFPVISEVCNICHVPYLSLIVDSPVMELYSESIRNPYNRIFLFDMALYNEFAPCNPGCIFHLPLATNVKRWDDVISHTSVSERARFSSEISFVGSLYTEKCPYYHLGFPSDQSRADYLRGYLEGQMRAQEKVYGYFFLEETISDSIVSEIVSASPNFYQFPEKSRRNDKAALCQLYLGPRVTEMERYDLLTALGKRYPVTLYTESDASSLPVCTRGRVQTLTEMPLAFHESDINLNLTAKSIRSGIPLRVWDVLGCHGFLICNYQAEIPEYLTPGEDIILYSSEEELLELTAYYRKHPAKRREIAENGYQKVKERHTYTVRVTEMLETAFQL